MEIPNPGFADDDGSASSALRAVITDYAEGRARYAEVLAILQHERLLVPVVAVLDSAMEDEHGHQVEKDSHMATVLTTGRDGRLAMLAFTGTDSLTRWNPEGRPVAAEPARVAAAARQDGAAAVVIDIAGPDMFVIHADEIAALADGFSLVEIAGQPAWAKVDEKAGERGGQ